MLANTMPEVSAKVKEPLHKLERLLLANQNKVNKWFERQWRNSVAPIYGSVDLRNAGFKVAPIDMNLFPAGFNNLNASFLSASGMAARKAIETVVPGAEKILIIAESHTRNLKYWENILTLKSIIEATGLQTRITMLSEELQAKQNIELQSGETVTVDVLQREGDQLKVEGFLPDLVLLNNDLSAGIPAVIQNLTQPLIPPAELGWSQRLKSNHFRYYENVVADFASVLDVDPWLLAPHFRNCGKIDFMAKSGMECVVDNATLLFAEIEAKYAAYNIPYQPFIVIKADAGTYGMAVMTVRSIDELKALNRKQRTRMSTSKGGQSVSQVIIQEGVYTFEKIGVNQAVAEPVVYLFGECVVGGFYRVHESRAHDESLNAPGMQFEPLPFEKSCTDPCDKSDPDATQNRYFLYGIVAQLSMLAAAREMADQRKGVTL